VNSMNNAEPQSSIRRLKILLGIISACFAAALVVHGQSGHITALEAKNHVGEKATVCGKVVSTHFASGSKGQPTFLNLDEPYPKRIFTVVIWGNDRSKFGEPDKAYRDKRVCVTGKITNFRGTPEIAASDPADIEVRR
jgi:hypothetical protein